MKTSEVFCYLAGWAFLICVMAACSGDPGQKNTSAAMSSTKLRIAYNVLVDWQADNYEVFMVKLDGTDKRNLSNHPAVDWVFSSWDSRLYFISDRDTSSRTFFFYEMDTGGNDLRRIYDHPVLDSWIHPRNEGNEFIIKTIKDGRKVFLIIDRNGTELSEVFGSEDFYFNDPCFSPDGKQIVFRYAASGMDELWIMNDDGSSMKQLTFYPSGASGENEHIYHAGPPFWEPNTNRISYTSRQYGNYNIYTISPDGGQSLQITPDAFNEGWHHWSPDASMLAFDGNDPEGNDYDIYLYSLENGKIEKLAGDTLIEQAPVFVSCFKSD